MNSLNPASEWLSTIREHFREGKKIEITPQGTSMYPSIRKNDRVILDSLADHTLRPGDICLYQRRDGMLVLHRLCLVTPEGYYFCGDHQHLLEGPLEENHILAYAIFIRRGRKLIAQTSLSRRLATFLILKTLPLRMRRTKGGQQ